MKIIGKDGSGGLIVTATEQELAAACGFTSTYDKEWKNRFPSGGIPVGAEIKISERLSRLVQIEQADKAVEVSVKALRDMADLMERASPLAMLPKPTPAPAT